MIWNFDIILCITCSSSQELKHNRQHSVSLLSPSRSRDVEFQVDLAQEVGFDPSFSASKLQL